MRLDKEGTRVVKKRNEEDEDKKSVDISAIVPSYKAGQITGQ